MVFDLSAFSGRLQSHGECPRATDSCASEERLGPRQFADGELLLFLGKRPLARNNLAQQRACQCFSVSTGNFNCSSSTSPIRCISKISFTPSEACCAVPRRIIVLAS